MFLKVYLNECLVFFKPVEEKFLKSLKFWQYRSEVKMYRLSVLCRDVVDVQVDRDLTALVLEDFRSCLRYKTEKNS